LSEIVSANPSLRGITFGYVAEYKLRKTWFADDRISDLVKYDDHDRARKGDIGFFYKGREIRVEVKSVQTNSIHKVGDEYVGRFQCDASDRRQVTLPNGQRVETTCLVVGEFDLLAVNLFGFEDEWRFAFAKNSDLPRSQHRKYTAKQRQYLLATSIEISLPLKPPFASEPFRLLDEIVREGKRARNPDTRRQNG
jgi:hypothetical protein